MSIMRYRGPGPAGPHDCEGSTCSVIWRGAGPGAGTFVPVPIDAYARRMRHGDLARLLGEHASKNLVPGAAVGVLRHGETITAYYGMASMNSGVPVTPDTRFAIGSLPTLGGACSGARLRR